MPDTNNGETKNTKKIGELSIADYKGLVPEGQNPNMYLKLVKEQLVGADLSTQDLQLFLYTAHRTGLDPLIGQIYAVPRWDSNLGRQKMTIQTGIDGFRLVAQRSAQYAGQDDAVFFPEDESTTHPVKATVTVYKVVGGARVPFTATARWAEYVQTKKDGTPSNLWARMPYLMLAKCAESLALRKAFPNELSGIYTAEEMSQSTVITTELPAPAKFKKEDKIQVESGAAVDAPKEKEIKPVDGEVVEEPKKATATPNKVAEMREKLSKEGDTQNEPSTTGK